MEEFTLTYLKAMKYKFYLHNEGRYPSVIILNPADHYRLWEEMNETQGENPKLLGIEVLRSPDVPVNEFRFYL
jgi:hypothetical protein